jgi:hypothetical protein
MHNVSSNTSTQPIMPGADQILFHDAMRFSAGFPEYCIPLTLAAEAKQTSALCLNL